MIHCRIREKFHESVTRGSMESALRGVSAEYEILYSPTVEAYPRFY